MQKRPWAKAACCWRITKISTVLFLIGALGGWFGRFFQRSEQGQLVGIQASGRVNMTLVCMCFDVDLLLELVEKGACAGIRSEGRKRVCSGRSTTSNNSGMERNNGRI
jgi:hypothetical protein